MLTRRSFIGAGLAASARLAAAPARPNIVLIVADDLGWGELSAQGFAKDIPTPNIDSIAKNRLFGTLDAYYENAKKVPLVFQGKFKARVGE